MFKSKNGGRCVARKCVGLLLAPSLAYGPAGCTTYPQASRRVEDSIDSWQRAQVALPAVHSTSQSVDSGVQEIASPISKSQIGSRPTDPYIQEALSRNPGLQAAAATARAKLERIPQVTSLPDPVIRALVRPEPVQTAAGDMYLTLGISQTFPMLARLERKGNIAAAETRMALEHLNALRIRLVADVERAYWQIYRLDRYLEITRENQRLLTDLENVIRTQYQVGRVPQQDLLRVQTELAKLRDDTHRFGVQRSSAIAALNQLTDHVSRRPVPTTPPVDVMRVNSDLDHLVTLAGNHNPELAILRERIERDREDLEFAKLGYWPDLTFGFEWSYVDGRAPFTPPINPQTGQRPPHSRKSDVGDDNWAVMVQMNVPIWADRVEAAKREARQKLTASQTELRSTENMVAFRIFDAWSRVEAQQHTLRVLESELIPQAGQTYEVTLTAYQAGEADFVTLIDNWRRWLDFALMRHRETVDLETAFADLQREVGMQLIRNQNNTNPDGE